MSSSGAICGGGIWKKQISRCPFCKRKTRHIFRWVFSGYSCESICGSCGNYIVDLEHLVSTDKKEKTKYIHQVRDIWIGKEESFHGTEKEYFDQYGPGQLMEKEDA
jgi:hypothetical protein